MKLLIDKNILLDGLTSVSKALSSRNIVPVLNGIKFELNKKGLYLTATDNDMTIQVYIDKKDINNIYEEGCTVIYGKSLLEIVRRLPDSEILIETFENNEVSFKTSNSIYNLNCFMPEDFPTIKIEDGKNPVTLDALKLKECINKTVFACSLQESRPLLTGINIKIQGDLFECTATDSYRLSKVTLKLPEISEENVNIVIPARNINELAKIISSEESCVMHIFSNKVIFKFDKLIFQSSLLNGNYPNTDNSIAKEFKYRIKADLKEFYNTLDRAALLTQTKDKNIIDVEINKDLFIIRAASVEMGKVEEKMAIENETDNNLKISFSAKYMLEALKMFNNEKIYILLNGEISPIILKDPESDELIELILPMKTY